MNTTVLQQLILAAGSISLLFIVQNRARRNLLSFGVALMWAGLALTGLVAAALVPLVGRAGSILGLLPAALFAGTASLLLGSISFSLSTRVSRLEERQRELAEVVGSLRLTPDVPVSRSPGEILAIVPAFNEERSVGSVVEGLRALGLQVLVIDDGSSDGTAAAAASSGASVLPLPHNLGVGGALRAGIRVALAVGYQQVVQCDADGQHPTESVLRLIDEQRRDPVELLIGSRFLESRARRNEGLVRFVATYILAMTASKAARTRITDASSGLRVIRSPLLDELAQSMPAHYLGDTFEVNVMAGRSGHRIREVPVVIQPRLFGRSSAAPAAAFRLTIRALLVVIFRVHSPLGHRE